MAAWADGVIQPGERRFLNTHFQKLKGLSAKDRENLHAMLLEKPLQSEVLLIFKNLRKATVLKDHRQQALDAVKETLSIDGVVSEDESGFLERLKTLINGDDDTYYQEMSKIIQGMKF